MTHQTIVITGASSGLGLGFLKHYISLPSPPTILALDTSPLPILQFPNNNGNSKDLKFYQLDVTSPDLQTHIANNFGSQPINLLIHCAGIRGLVKHIVENQRGDVAAAETLNVMDHATMLRTFEINTWGTFNVVKAFLPNLQLAAKAHEQPKVVILSSRMGSVAANTAGGGYAYRASKAALNAVVKSFSIDVPEVKFLLLHPGRVETRLVEWKEEGAISVEESLKDCLNIIDGLEGEDSRTLVDRFGVEIPW